VTPVTAVTRATAAAAGLPGRGDADAGGADGHAVKCALDQLFFASQGDVLFLALCAYHDSADVPEAIAEVKRNSLTTWINDCAVWPLVNLVGFAALPTSLLPSYMAAMQLFWQLSLSFASQHTHQQQHAAHAAALRPPPGAEAQRGGPAGVRDADAARGPAAPPDASARGATVPASVLAAQPLLAPVPCDDAALEAVFAGFDADGNGRIDADELRAALLRRGVALTTAEAVGMVRAVDRDGDASVDLLEFKSIARVQGAGAQGVEAKLWKAAITRQHLRLLEKQSLRGAVKRHEQFERAKVRRRESKVYATAEETLAAHGGGGGGAAGVAPSQPQALAAAPDGAPPMQRSALLAAILAPASSAERDMDSAADAEWRRERNDAVRNCATGMGLLGLTVLARRGVLRATASRAAAPARKEPT
jgi:hypothetical protein